MSSRSSGAERGQFDVSAARAFLAHSVHAHPRLWIKAGQAETLILRAELRGVAVTKPVFITGLPRSGTTILLELLATMRGVVTHRYRDFPGIFIPCGWNWFVDRASRRPLAPRERAHQDGLMVTPESPEAMEEPLWMAFFPGAHDPTRSNVLDRAMRNTAFESFYRDHLRKLLWLRRGARYVAKGNYNITRMAYLHRLFPDARFVIPVRDPVSQVASLVRQHALFSQRLVHNRGGLAHLRGSGHFEFGPERRPINTGNTERVREIQDLWARQEGARGWARYWEMIYAFVLNELEGDESLRKAACIVRYEDLCAQTMASLGTIAAHCDLEPGPVIREICARVRRPVDGPELSAADRAAVREEAGQRAADFGYEIGAGVR